jgi:hypothetical protein
MLTWYWKTLYTALVILAWLWALSTAFAGLSSASDLGVVLGVAGIITASFAATWLIARIHKKRRKQNAQLPSGSTGGAS